MGLLRLLLAFIVILAHTASSWRMISGVMAVETFFIISGFYMALILNEKYKGVGATWLFYTNRIWRLFPLYWLLTAAVLFVSIISWKTGHDPLWLAWWLKWGGQLDWPTKVYLVFINLFALGQDTVFFVSLHKGTGHLEIVKSFWETNPPIYRFLFIGQAWSMSVELMFYMIAPFIVRRRWLVAVLFSLFLAFRIRVGISSWGFDPWVGRFLPSELPLFLAGVLAYYAYTKIRTLQVPTWLMYGAIFILVLVTAVYQWLPGGRYLPSCYFTLFALTIPLAFQLTKSNRRDAALGEYSFPIYIAHTLPLAFVEKLCQHYGWSHDVSAVIETACVLPIAWLLIRYIGDPIEKLRAMRAKKLSVVQALHAV